MQDIYSRVLEALVREFSGAGAIGGVSTPLGTGPKAGSGPGSIYKSSKATDKKHRSKGKKKKTHTKSVQWYLKNGGERGKKKSFKESLLYYLSLPLNEARTARIKDFSKEEIIGFLRYLKGEVGENITFSTTEKIAGQSMTVGIRGTSKGNAIYCGTKDSIIQMGGDIFNSRFYKSRGTSRLVKNAFIKKFRKLQPGEEIILGMEIVLSDYSKPDYIAYHVPKDKQIAAVFSISPQGSFTRSDADSLSGKYWSRRHRAYTNIDFLMPEDIPLSPLVDLDQAIVDEIDEIITLVENSPSSRNKGDQYPVKSYIDRNVSPRIRSLVKTIFPSSNINASSPIEGIAVNMSNNNVNTFFKVPSQDFDKLQSIQASVYAEFKTSSRNNMSRAEGFIEQLENPTTGQSFARNVFKLIRYLNDVETLPLNYRTFFTPNKFKQFCSMILQGLQTKNTKIISDAIYLISTRLKTSTGNENYKSTESQQLVDFIDQNNLI